MTCPNCNYDYREGITVCPECGTALVEKDLANEPTKNAYPREKAMCAAVAADEIEAEIMIAKLRVENIYAFKKFRGSDSYNRILLGRAILGVEIMVAASDLETAKEILEN